MDVQVLGPVQVWHGGTALLFPRRQQRLILGILAIEANRVVPAERLIDLVWADRPPTHVRAVVQSRVSELRGILGSATRAAPELTIDLSADSGYLLRADPDLIDAHRFRKQVKQARTVGHDERACELLRAATRLWRGRVLGGWLPRESHDAVCHALESEHVSALETLFEIELRLGHHLEIVDHVIAVAASNPGREQMTGQAMLALHRCARTAEALQLYDRYRRSMAEEFGIDPGAELQELHVRILRGDRVPTDGDVVRTPPDSPDPAEVVMEGFQVGVPRTLPAGIPDFTGRAKEVEHIVDLLTCPGDGVVPVAVVAGAAGVGKSALCVHVAHRLSGRFPHGQLYVDLHGVDQPDPPSPGEVLARFLRALGVESTLPDSIDERAELYRSLVAGRRVLVVLDNARDAGQVRPLIPGSPTCSVLINSRARLAAAIGGVAVDLEVLPLPESVRLLARIAGQERIEADQHAAARLAQLCGGLPLALRIAAARLVAKPHWTVERLADRLADERRRLDQLAYGQLDVRTSIALSYTGIRPSAQRLLCRLGDLDLPDVDVWSSAALLDTHPADAEETLELLHDAQLLAIAGQEPTGHSRYWLHDLVRLFAKERAEVDETPSTLAHARRRTFGAWLYLTEMAYGNVYGGDSENIPSPALRHVVDEDLARALTNDPLYWFDSQRRSIISMIHRAARERDSQACWGLVCTSFSLFEMLRQFEECKDPLLVALTLARATSDDLGRAALLYRQGTLSGDRNDYEHAVAQWQEAADLFERVGDSHGSALAQFRVATQYRQQGQSEVALGLFRHAVDDLNRCGDHGAEAFALRNIGQAHLVAGEYSEAEVQLARALDLARRSKSRRREAQALFWYGMLRLKQLRHRDAEGMFVEVLELTRVLGDRPGQIQAQRGLGLCHAGLGDAQRAQAMLREALRLARQPTPTLLERRITEELAKLSRP